ncbi:MAG: MotB family protein [Mesorhizobium sp.]|nr:MotB family protein [Mesorhizobium sp.]
MSSVGSAEKLHEIIIVRHGGHGDHDDHHGGAWKIAFADFMTAMMCFFLVMWLINAANEETKVAVASYFNPIKLVDRNASRKGLDDEGEGPTAPDEGRRDIVEPSVEPTGAGPKISGPAQRSPATESADDVKHTDSHLFSDPYSVLAEIAADTGNLQNISAKGDGGAQVSGPATGASGGESFRDPFAPDFWSQEVVPTLDPAPAQSEAERAEALAKKAPDEASAAEAAEAVAKPEPFEQAAPAEPHVAVTASADTPAPPPEAETVSQADERKADEIRKELRDAFGGDKVFEGMSVEATENGVAISVTDMLDFGMFEIGSAVPRRDLVLAMEKIARILSSRDGKITINGHTDGRPFSNKTYDNWRLSTARAHSAYYMLVRAGLDERRIAEVGGFADRKLKIPADPLAAGNRRIEILLESGG